MVILIQLIGCIKLDNTTFMLYNLYHEEYN